MNTGRSIRLFLVDGSPTGLITAEIPNWTGHILVAPRSRIAEALARPEAAKTGVYLLIGEDAGRDSVYVGEGDCISDRIRKHAKDPDKDFWERVCLVTSKDVNLTKAHVRYLENRLVQIIVTGGRARVVNGNEPPAGMLPEADLSDMEFFLSQLQILLPTVGLDFLRPKPATTNLVTATEVQIQAANQMPQRIYLTLSHKLTGVEGKAFEDDGEFVVLEGSVGTDRLNASNTYAGLREALIADGKLEILSNGTTRFTDDVAFKSPSAAAAVLNNRNSAGPREWKLESTGQALREWRDALLEAEPVAMQANP